MGDESGSNHKLHLAVRDIVNDLKSFVEHVTEEELEVAIKQTETYQNYYALCPHYYIMPIRTSIIQTWHASYYEKFRLARLIKSRDTMQQFCRQFFKQIKILALVQGNLSGEEAKSIVLMVEADLGCVKIDDVS